MSVKERFDSMIASPAQIVLVSYSVINWGFMSVVRFLLDGSEYISLMLKYGYAHFFAGFIGFVLIHSRLRSDQLHRYDSSNSSKILLILFFLTIPFSILYSRYFALYGVSFLMKELLIRDLKLTIYPLKYWLLIGHFLTLFIWALISFFHTISSQEVMIILTCGNLFYFVLPLRNIKQWDLPTIQKKDFHGISVPLVNHSRHLFYQEYLVRFFAPVIYADFVWLRVLLGPLGQLASLINLEAVNASEKFNQLFHKFIITLLGISAITIFAYVFGMRMAFVVAIVYVLSDLIINTASYRLFLSSRFKQFTYVLFAYYGAMYLGYEIVGASLMFVVISLVFLQMALLKLVSNE